ncbi:MAG: hypothetical protein ACJA2S_003039, partial [Cyclobacteriaceae bacterium]
MLNSVCQLSRWLKFLLLFTPALKGEVIKNQLSLK